jgi:hypothetical protein|nr:hypothetical protein [Candidatus Acidoferrales bacterium]
MGPYWMIFELLFILIFFGTVVSLVTAAIQAIRGRSRNALRILGVLAASLAVYFTICCLSTILTPRRVLTIGEPQCFDDWCIELSGANKTAAGSIVTYQTSIRIFSRARRVAQRENGAVLYLEDDRGVRYAELPNPSDIPTDVLLQAGDSVTITRSFQLPATAHAAGFVVTKSGFPIGWFVIGEGQSLFHKEAITRLQ